MIEIKITAQNVDELKMWLAALSTQPEVVEEAPKKKVAKEVKPAVVVVPEVTPEPEVAPEPEVEPEVTPEPEVVKEAPAVTAAMVKELATKLIAAQKQAEVHPIIKAEAPSIGKIPEDRLAAVYSKLQAIK